MSRPHHSPLNRFQPIDRQSAQEKRRNTALEIQSQARQNQFEQARSRNILSLDDLDLDPFKDAEDQESMELDSNLPISNRKKKRLAAHALYQPWAKNLLQFAETFDFNSPPSLEIWSVLIAPIGKRSLLVTARDGSLELLSRISGRLRIKSKSSLPFGTYLDGIWDEEQGVFWVLDIIRWKNLFYIDHEFEFRSFFLSSKMAELPLPSSTDLRILPVPTFNQLSPTIFKNSIFPSLLPSLITVNLNDSPSKTINLIPEGLLLYFNSSTYISGSTPLALWIPMKSEVIKDNLDGKAVMEVEEEITEMQKFQKLILEGL